MYEDEPQESVFDALCEAVFGEHPLGRSIIGRAPVIADTPVDQIAAFHARRYVPGSVVVGAAGSVDHDAIVELATRALDGLRAGEVAPVAEGAPEDPAPTVRFQRKDTEQVHVCLGGVGIRRDDERRYALRVADAIFGGLSSSRLFQAVREERGLAYSVYSFGGQFTDTGQVGLYLGTRPDNLGEAMRVVSEELDRLREEPATQVELERAHAPPGVQRAARDAAAGDRRGHGARRRRLARRPARPGRRPVGARPPVGRGHRPRRGRVPRRRRDRLPGDRVSVRVAVAGAAGRMGQAVCAAVDGADDLELTGRADPSLGTSLGDVLGDADVVVDFTIPDQAIANARACLSAGVHVVIGTTGFDLDELRAVCAEHPDATAFVAPNFAIGAVLMMRFAAEASRHMQSAEIVEYHHPAKLDAPSGTAKRTAGLMEGDVPIHSLRLPGVVADQDVVLGDVAQTLTIRHQTTDRTSFMPGVLLAIRSVGRLEGSPTVGLERLLWPSG